jgi:hypothetical protein
MVGDNALGDLVFQPPVRITDDNNGGDDGDGDGDGGGEALLPKVVAEMQLAQVKGVMMLRLRARLGEYLSTIVSATAPPKNICPHRASPFVEINL